MLGDDEINAFCDHVVGAWTEANEEVSTIELLKEALDQAKAEGKIKEFARDMLQNDEVLLVGVYKVEPPPTKELVQLDDLVKLLSQSLFQGICQTSDEALIRGLITEKFPNRTSAFSN